MLGKDLVGSALAARGFDRVFAMLGGTNVQWAVQAEASGALVLVRTRHEDAAVAAAIGAARTTGRPACCTVSRGPGFTNSITALAAAAKSSVPILLITGESSNRRLSSQDIDQRALAEIAGAGYQEARSAAELLSVLDSAVDVLESRGVPQVIEIETSIYGIASPVMTSHATRRKASTVIPDRDAIAHAADALDGAAHPLILAGAGALFSGASTTLAEIAHLTAARLATTLRTNHMFSGDPHDIGLCGGWSPPPVRSALAETDVVIAAGASLNHYTTAEGLAFPNASIYHLDFAPQPGLHSVQGDLRYTVPALRAAVEERLGDESVRRPAPEVPGREQLLDSVFSVPAGHDPSRGIDPIRLYERLDALLPEDRIVVTDTGRFLGTIPTIIRARDALSWLDGNSFSAIGLGLGTAIGAASANPERPIVLITGDGGFTLASHDLASITTNRLNLTVVIVNDRQLGSEAKYLRALSLPGDAIKLDMPDAVLLARAVGGEGVVIDRLEQLDRIDFRRLGLQLIDVRVDPEVDVRSVIARWAA